MEVQLNPLDIVLDTWEKLGPVERRVLATLATRIYAGQRRYGLLEYNKKAWTWEACEEALDQSVYLACELLNATEEAKRRYRDEVNGETIGEPAPVRLRTVYPQDGNVGPEERPLDVEKPEG